MERRIKETAFSLGCRLYPRSMSSLFRRRQPGFWCCSSPASHCPAAPPLAACNWRHLGWVSLPCVVPVRAAAAQRLQDRSQQEWFCPNLHLLFAVCVFIGLVFFFVGGEKGLPSKGLNRGVNNKARRLRALTCAIYLGHQTRTISLRSCGRWFS